MCGKVLGASTIKFGKNKQEHNWGTVWIRKTALSFCAKRILKTILRGSISAEYIRAIQTPGWI
jgi:hypothetical protein